jgi:hypothetical protein
MGKTPRKSYRVVPQKDLTYGVEVSDGKSVPTVVTSFATVLEARIWILEQKRDGLHKTARNELKKRGL